MVQTGDYRKIVPERGNLSSMCRVTLILFASCGILRLLKNAADCNIRLNCTDRFSLQDTVLDHLIKLYNDESSLYH